MKKLKKFNLNQGKILSTKELSTLCGGEFISGSCSYAGQKCYVTANGGINTGTCGWYYSSASKQELTCKI